MKQKRTHENQVGPECVQRQASGTNPPMGLNSLISIWSFIKCPYIAVVKCEGYGETMNLRTQTPLRFCSHHTTGCYEDRLLTMMTDMGFSVPWRVGYSFRLAKLLEKLYGTLWWMSTLVSVERSYRSKLTLYLSQMKPHLIIISEVSRGKSQKNGYLIRLFVSPSTSAVCYYIQ